MFDWYHIAVAETGESLFSRRHDPPQTVLITWEIGSKKESLQTEKTRVFAPTNFIYNLYSSH